MNVQKNLVRSLILGDTKPKQRTIDRIRNEEKMPSMLRYKSGSTGLKFTYEHDLETAKETVLN